MPLSDVFTWTFIFVQSCNLTDAVSIVTSYLTQTRNVAINTTQNSVDHPL